MMRSLILTVAHHLGQTLVATLKTPDGVVIWWAQDTSRSDLIARAYRENPNDSIAVA